VADETIVSYAQNGEDVVLWRALSHIQAGIYVDVGGFDPDNDSVTRLFYERGWRGVDVEPVPDFAERFRVRRPENEVVEAVVTDLDVDEVVLHRFGSTGLSTLDDDVAGRHTESGLHYIDLRVQTRKLDDVLEASQLVDETIHFLKVDVEGAEDQVLRSLDLKRWRPWVLVIEATAPNINESTADAWEPLVLEAGYSFTLFDGLSRFYVAKEHPELEEALSYPACVLDGYVTAVQVRLERQLAKLTRADAETVNWRNQAVAYWAESVASTQAADEIKTRAELDNERLTLLLNRARNKTQRLRKERDRLRTQVERMKTRIRRMRTRIDELQSPGTDPTRSGLARLRGAVRGTRNE
jgi:FkbM family methyltransferase